MRARPRLLTFALVHDAPRDPESVRPARLKVRAVREVAHVRVVRRFLVEPGHLGSDGLNAMRKSAFALAIFHVLRWRDPALEGKRRGNIRGQIVERFPTPGNSQSLHSTHKRRDPFNTDNILEEVVGERRAAMGRRDGRERPDAEVGRFEVRDEEAAVEASLRGSQRKISFSAATSLFSETRGAAVWHAPSNDRSG